MADYGYDSGGQKFRDSQAERAAQARRVEAEEVAEAAENMRNIQPPGNKIAAEAAEVAAAQAARENENPFGVKYNIAQGGCSTSLPEFPLPKVGQTKETTMDVYLIWAMEPSSPDAPWVVSAWDEYSRQENEDGWWEDLAKQEELYGGRYVRVTRTTVNYDKVQSAFDPVVV